MIIVADTRPAPFPFTHTLPERSSPSRVRYAAQNARALDRSGPFRNHPQTRERGPMQRHALDHVNNVAG